MSVASLYRLIAGVAKLIIVMNSNSGHENVSHNLVPDTTGWEYETGKLAFLMDATVSASVLWHGLKTYPFTFTIHNYYIKVSETTEYDRSLCNCSQMTQGTRDAIREVGEHVNASQPVILPLEGGEGEQYDE